MALLEILAAAVETRIVAAELRCSVHERVLLLKGELARTLLEINAAFAAANPTILIRGIGLKDYNANAAGAVAPARGECRFCLPICFRSGKMRNGGNPNEPFSQAQGSKPTHSSRRLVWHRTRGSRLHATRRDRGRAAARDTGCVSGSRHRESVSSGGCSGACRCRCCHCVLQAEDPGVFPAQPAGLGAFRYRAQR